MCGFTAFFSFTSPGEETIERLNQCNREMHYRGPNDQDIWYDDKVGLAHVRLSIIGIDNGHQPIFNEDSSLVLVCNGEIYNFRSLREKLIAAGHTFSTESDCEVIVHLYEEKGPECINDLDGMFAFCLWDIKTQTLLIGRDPAGQKPLYYTLTTEGIVFSSELKAIRKYFIPKPTINYEVLRQVQKYSFPISAVETHIEEIRKLPHGSYALVDQTNGLKIMRYYNRTIAPVFTGDYASACTKVRELLTESVKKRLQSEVPVAILLSAGVDSSGIATIARELVDEVHVICAGYAGEHDVDERKEAKKLANEKGFIWHEVELDSKDYANYLEEILPVLDEPVADVAMFAQWGIYRKAKEMGFTVLLSGNGGDELFYGYESHNNNARGREWLEQQKEFFPQYSKLRLLQNFITKFQWRDIIKYAPDLNILNVRPVHPDIAMRADQRGNRLEKEDWFRKELPYFIDRVYNFSHYAWLANNCYFLGDKLAMANSIEVRSPFVDKELIAFVDQLPIELKFPESRPKKLLRDALAPLLPNYVLNRSKSGFTPPNDFINTIIDNHRQLALRDPVIHFHQLITDVFVHQALNPFDVVRT